MERTDQPCPDLVDLGDVTETTKGPWGHYADDVLMQQMAGLASD